MKYSYQWLKELSGTTKSPEELAEFLTMRAFEVEGVEKVGFDLDNVVIGEVLELEKHANADKLRVAKVNVGSETLQIVCGAPNVAVGQRVPVALVGATLPGNFEIQKREVRGVESNGMICSQKELGLGEDHEGIWVLAEDAPAGDPLKDFLNDADALLDIKVLPDRAHDALNHVGMAREIAALEGGPARNAPATEDRGAGGELDYDYDGLELEEPVAQDLAAEISVGDKSKRYIGALMKNVVVKDSPAWLQNRLKKLGLRPINNIVDVTNYVMLELGQPLHAFDWNAIAKEDGRGRVSVRFAKPGEKIVLLDEKEYELGGQDLVIADAEKALALAGIMGGAHSGVKAETTDILFEAASFDPVSIRRTRTRLGLRTDASDRFEKGLDPNLAEKAMVRALELVRHVAGGESAGATDVYPHPVKSLELALDPEKVESLLGIPIEAKAIKTLLERIGCRVEKADGHLQVTVPTWRLDIQSPEDLIEEIGKGVGYDAVPAVAPLVPLQGVGLDRRRILERGLKDAMAVSGFTETYNYSFYGEGDAEAARLESAGHLKLANPMNADQALMRTTLAVGLLKNVRENLKHVSSLDMFELGRLYFPTEDGKVKEEKRLAGVLARDGKDENGENFFLLKGLLQRILEGLGMSAEFDTANEPGSFWHPTRTADILCHPELVSGPRSNKGNVLIGRIGEIHPFVTERFRIKKRVAYFELDLEALLQALPKEKTFVPMRKYPEVLRDISLYVPNNVRVKDIVDGVKAAGGESVLETELFDQYFDEAKGMKSLAFHIHFGADDRTLSGEEADALLQKISDSLEQNLGAERRV
jgi:phenylalanyl-tRNA synthetase beta chain